ncbi:hypothetical protein [Cupriavidus pauculus]|uniref:hypothetical protein n=1 Tax=Cupriavidus pauculus TaxID=82633 RepID=UPI0015E01392|nr:hypothetical protein [Cupriavidus pauculus]
MSKSKITKPMRRALEVQAEKASSGEFRSFRTPTLIACIKAGLMRWGANGGLEITDAGYTAIGRSNQRTEYPCGYMQGRGAA